jgi:hypothetical protein
MTFEDNTLADIRGQLIELERQLEQLAQRSQTRTTLETGKRPAHRGARLRSLPVALTRTKSSSRPTHHRSAFLH